MKAFRVEAPEKFAVVEVETPRVGPHDLLLKVEAAGICGSDVDVIHGQRTGLIHYPAVLGHEFSGTVVEVGREVGNTFRVGDRLACMAMLGCGTCSSCLSGQTLLCTGHYEEIGLSLPGGMAEYVVVPGRACFRVPDAVSLEEVAVTEPASCALRGVRTRGRLRANETVVIMGCGFIGMMAVQFARLYSPRHLVAVDIVPEKLKLARELGATHAVNSREEDPVKVVRDITGGKMADLAVECAGSVRSVEAGIDCVGVSGREVVIGCTGGHQKFSYEPDQLVARELSIIGSAAYLKEDYVTFLDLLAAGKINVKPLITHRFPLREAVEAFKLADDPGSARVKILLVP